MSDMMCHYTGRHTCVNTTLSYEDGWWIADYGRCLKCGSYIIDVRNARDVIP